MRSKLINTSEYHLRDSPKARKEPANPNTSIHLMGSPQQILKYASFFTTHSIGKEHNRTIDISQEK